MPHRSTEVADLVADAKLMAAYAARVGRLANGDILASIADGHTVRQTARTLGIATKTVENTQARLFRKLGARNRAGVLTIAYRLGLIDPAGPNPAGPDGGGPNHGGNHGGAPPLSPS